MIALQEDVARSADVIIIGASTRAAAFSALRAGLRPYCLDMFADADAAAQVPVRCVTNYPDGLIPLLEALPCMPVIYTGGLENRLDILELVDERHDLWGNRPTVVRRCRNQEALAEAARLARLEIPEIYPENEIPPQDGTWILRPSHGAGGRGIVSWTPAQSDSVTLQEPHLFQKKIEGLACSAVFIAPPIVGDVRFVGMTRQLVGEPLCHAAEFQWCGNIGPIALPVGIENIVRRFGNVLKWKLGLLGLFGVDLIISPDGVPYVIEVNPRYPASVELLEHATGQPLLADHCRCFTTMSLPASNWNYAHPGEFMGKAVFYSPRDCDMDQPLADPASVPVREFPLMADLPAPGQKIRSGDPVCTLFAESYSSDQTWQLLQEQLQQLDQKFQ